MSASAMSPAPFLIDGRAMDMVNSGGLYGELLERASRDDDAQWLSVAVGAGGCVRPIRLRGTIRDLDPASGEIVHSLDTEDPPDRVIYLPCGDRRDSVCPPCAQTYRADIYQLIRSGLAGGKGMPESVAIHPCAFATFTAPSFGPYTPASSCPLARSPGAGPAVRPSSARMAAACPAGNAMAKTDACLGRPAMHRLLRLRRRRGMERPRPGTVAAYHHRHPSPPREDRRASAVQVSCRTRRWPSSSPAA